MCRVVLREQRCVESLPGLGLPTEESEVSKWKFSRPVADDLVVHLGRGANTDQAHALLHEWLPCIQVNCSCGTFVLEDWHPNGVQDLGVRGLAAQPPSPAQQIDGG